MPLYEYECKKCKHRFEEIRKFSDKQPTKCPECGGPIEQVISAPAVQFKGSGWYVTDYAKKGSSSASSLSSSESESNKESKESKESKDSKESKESGDTKDSKDSKKADKPKSESSSKKQKKD
jgi:putative FmdB family regulatory protein